MATTKTAPKTQSSAPGEHPGAAAGTGAQALAVQGSGALALPADLMAELAGAAKDAAASERPKLSKISLKSGMMTYQGAQIPGDAMDVVILACGYRNTFYSGAYDPDNITNPTCFAISSNGEDMEAHPNVALSNIPVSSQKVPRPTPRSCEGCSKNDWGTAIRDGKPSKGKACKEGRRMLIVPADGIANLEAFKTAEMAVVDVPVTSVDNFANYVNTLSAAVQRPMWAVVTKLKLVRDLRTQFKLTFEALYAINDADVIRAIKGRLDDAMRIATIPFDETELDKPAAPAGPAKSAKFKQQGVRT